MKLNILTRDHHGFTCKYMHNFFYTTATAAVAQWARAFASQAEGWVFESQLQQTHVVKTSSDIPMAKRSA